MTDGADANADEFLDVIRATRARYASSFSAQVDHLRTLSDNPTHDQFKTLRTAVHRMVGLSSTLGFHSVGALVAELESILDANVVSGAFDGDAVRRVIESMDAAFARDLDTPPSWVSADLE